MSNIRKNDILIISLIVVVVFLFRILYFDIFQSLIVRYGFQVSDVFQSFVGNIIVLLLSIILDTIGVWVLSKMQPYGQNSLARFLSDIALMFLVSAIGALILDYPEFLKHDIAFGGYYYLFSLLSLFLFNAFLIVILDIVFYALRVRESVYNERLNKRKAEYQYYKLKEQVNPHFLFNSLNMLDYLVQSNENDRASEYIKKLASVYRYFLQTNDAELVTIEEELLFVKHYVDLLKVRFPEGIDFQVDVPDEYIDRLIIPCGLQMLVENAIKHNVVSKSEPLTIQIKVEDGWLIVINNIQLRLTIDDSMNVGLNNIQARYKDITGREVGIFMDEKEFIVKLPIV